MKVRFLPLAMIALFLVFSNNDAYSQGSTPIKPEGRGLPIYIGPTLGVNRSFHNVTLPTFSDDLCPKFDNASDFGFFVGFTGEYQIGDVKDSKSSIIARVLYNSLPASQSVDGSKYPSLVKTTGGEDVLVNSQTNHSIEVKYDLITFDLAYKLNFADNLGITVGPTFDFAMKKEKEQIFELIEPDNIFFEPVDGKNYRDNYRTLVVEEGEIIDSQSLRIGIKIGIQYEILMGRQYIVPSIWYNKGVTKLASSGDSWYVDAIQIGCDIRFSL